MRTGCQRENYGVVSGITNPAVRCSLRVRSFRLWPLLLGISLAATATLPAQDARRVIVTAPPLPSVQEIVRRALANDELRRQHRLALVCDQTITTERLDDQGEVFKSKTLHVPYREGAGISFSTDVEFPAETDRHPRHRDGDIAKADHRMALMNLRRLAPRFQCALTGEAAVRGRDCYVVEYSPRRGQAADTREEKVINQLHGRFWIDKKSFEILQGEGSLAAPVPVAWLASVIRLDFAFHTQTMPNGEAGPADFHVDLAAKAPFYFYRQQQTTQLENWRPGGD